jgi:hypothetical protein
MMMNPSKKLLRQHAACRNAQRKSGRRTTATTHDRFHSATKRQSIIEVEEEREDEEDEDEDEEVSTPVPRPSSSRLARRFTSSPADIAP